LPHFYNNKKLLKDNIIIFFSGFKEGSSGTREPGVVDFPAEIVYYYIDD